MIRILLKNMQKKYNLILSMNTNYEIYRDNLNETQVYIKNKSGYIPQGSRTEYNTLASDDKDFKNLSKQFSTIIGRENTTLLDIGNDEPQTPFLQSTSSFMKKDNNLIHRAETSHNRRRGNIANNSLNTLRTGTEQRQREARQKTFMSNRTKFGKQSEFQNFTEMKRSLKRR